MLDVAQIVDECKLGRRIAAVLMEMLGEMTSEEYQASGPLSILAVRLSIVCIRTEVLIELNIFLITGLCTSM